MSLANSDWLWAAWTQVWQVTVLIVVVAILARIVACNRPHLASALWLVVFLKCITPPLWSSPTSAFCWLQPPQAATANDWPTTLSVALLPADTKIAATASRQTDSGVRLRDDNGQAYRWGLELLNPLVLLTMIWGMGSLAVLATIATQRRRIVNLIQRADANASAPHNATLMNLASRLRIHRSVRLVVTERLVGPAVLGLFRPTVILPRVVIDHKSASEIELILAHELMHVRRNDLWLALLRSLALSLWWFHPLVWWATRRASREAERCCDDAVLAELRCSPSSYARCLLDILEIKHRLLPMPAFCGVQAIEINQGRLERIMKIGHGGYRRTPWWCWAVTLLVAIAVMPGAAMHISADEGTGDSAPTASSRPVVQDWAAGSSNAYAPPPDMKYRVVYYVSDVLAKIRAEEDLSESKAKIFLEAWVKNPPGYEAYAARKSVSLGEVTWRDNNLVVQANRAGHTQVGSLLESLKKFGTAQIAIETRFVTMTDEEYQKVLSDSTLAPLSVDRGTLDAAKAVQPAAFERPLASHDGTCVARAQFVVEKNSPMRFRILDKEEGEKLIQRCQDDRRSNVLQAPKVTVFNGQTAVVCDTSKIPFVVGVIPVVGDFAVAQQPQIREFSEGTSLQLRPVASLSGAIHLDFAAAFSKIEEVETVTFNRTANSGTTVQIPKVATVRMEGGADLKPGQWLLLGGSERKDQAAKSEVTPVSWKDWLFSGGKRQSQPHTQELVLMLRAEKIESPHTIASHAVTVAEHN